MFPGQAKTRKFIVLQCEKILFIFCIDVYIFCMTCVLNNMYKIIIIFIEVNTKILLESFFILASYAGSYLIELMKETVLH